jgi:predicted DNA-binding transcriptional regulator AlpA
MTNDSILQAGEVDDLLAELMCCSPSTAKRWRLTDPSFPKPCTPAVARPRWRRADIVAWVNSL